MNKADLRLTDAELDAIRKASMKLSTFGELQAVAAAQREKMGRGVVAWLRSIAGTPAGENVWVAAKELEAMLNEEAHDVPAE